jgi:periplasmic divalent cation tolerance protein
MRPERGAPPEYIFVYTTFPAEADAAAVARRVIEKRLASCANIFPKARSFYHWDGAVQDTQETIMILKTRRDQWDALRQAIETGHPYEIPCITAISMMDANASFLTWLDQQVL